MTQIDEKKFQEAYRAASENTRDLMRDSRICESLVKASTKLGLSIDTSLLILPFGYYFLGLFSQETLYGELSSLGITDSEDFCAEVLSYIENTEVPLTDTDSVEPNVPLISSALETEIPPLRTMPQAPAGSEPVYTSTQAAILHESAQSVPAPTPSPARWETEQ